MNWIKETHKWTIPAFILLAVCADIEYELLLVPSITNKMGSATNEIIKALSYSYIAAAIFHLIVNYLPNKQRTKKLARYIEIQIGDIKELIRQSKEVSCPFDFNSGIDREEYVSKFDKVDLNECWIDQSRTKLSKLNELKERINTHIDNLLSLKEFLSNAQFDYLSDMKSSLFLSHEIYPHNVERPYSPNNQKEIGEAIYNLYERRNNLK